MLLAFACVLSFFAGYPYLVLMQIVFFFIWHWYHKRISLSAIQTLSGAGLIALCISAVQLFPAIELFVHSERGIQGISLNVIRHYSLVLRDFAGVVWPYFMRLHPFQITGEKTFWAFGMYVGVLVCILSCWGFIKIRLRNKLITVFIGTAIVFISCGVHLPFFEDVYRFIPILFFFRYPSLIIYVLIGIILILVIRFGQTFKKGSMLVLSGIIAEMLILNYQPLPTIHQAYFYSKGPLVSFLQDQKTPCRYLLSPRTQNNLEIPALTPVQGWLSIKHMLHGRSGIHYHVYNAHGSGEPLTLETHGSMIHQILYGDLDTALLNASIAHIRHIVFSYPVDRRYNPVRLSSMIYIVKNPAIDSCQYLKQMYFPGWRLFLDTKEIPLKPDEHGFAVPAQPVSETNNLVYYYMPHSFRIGLWISIFMIGIMCMLYFRTLTQHCSSLP
ncbi:MAG: hypothetical protein GF384_06280 [Elusimicrobia bacterium]|nr:hypothetical protein [Elusimicrobiota bacterium]MBD3412327.1 hypothetical protein [Elusimicrobiota bacterium]